MPEQVRSLVIEWKQHYRKATISVENVTAFYASEDAHVTLVNLTTGKSGFARVAGDFAGLTRLSPTDAIPLPVGVVAVETGFFLGVPFLRLLQGSATQVNDGN